MTRCPPWMLLALLIAAFIVGCARSGKDAAPVVPRPAPEGKGGALFDDVTARAGIHFVHANGATGKLYYAEMSPAGCALFDYDDDGYLDLLLVQSGPLSPDPSPTDRTARSTITTAMERSRT